MSGKRHIIKSVNISQNHAKILLRELHNKPLQYEFDFCEFMPELIVKNMLTLHEQNVINTKKYDDSQVVHILRRPGWDFRKL